MSKSKNALYLTHQIRLCEQHAIDELGISQELLMRRAGTAAFNTLTSLYPDVRDIAVFCGGGNNAGDAYVLARLAHEEGFSVLLVQCKEIEQLPPVAQIMARDAASSGVPCKSFDDVSLCEAELIVDGLLGIGLKGTVQGQIALAIQFINDSQQPVLSLDIPSGLDADLGCVMGLCVRASVTVTFMAEKIGLYILDGPDHAGKVICHSLQAAAGLASLSPAAYRLDDTAFHGIMPSRLKNSHKGDYGHVLIIGGGLGMPGATYLTALAALRVGAGSVTIATRPEYAESVLPGLPEVMIHGVDEIDSLKSLLSKATISVIGPGLGEDEWAQSLFATTIAAQVPLVIDASALRLLAKQPQHDDNWILTPHPGEAASLLACSTSDIQKNRHQAVQQIQQQYGGCVVLKGCGTVVNTGEPVSYICTSGNPGMATAGMGDVLSGVIGGLLAQGILLSDAAKLGVWLHARAADEAVLSLGERGLMASDLMPYLRRQINQCS
ncbi:MAG: NAD(P)H-hydrate dehydratase [Legionellales bacterium]|nr:NAD(P)H-hydrate dehydratase [Legionellales bacterium]